MPVHKIKTNYQINELQMGIKLYNKRKFTHVYILSHPKALQVNHARTQNNKRLKCHEVISWN